MVLLKIILWYFDNTMTHCQEEMILIIAYFIFAVFCLKESTFSVLYIYRNCRSLYIQLFVLILNEGKVAVNEPLFVL